ncbi:unnamed protein product [Hyaloperonospora brassicae]|uniref:RxLR effector candidate protein n=1 Tax=Hyaloperonospora brassicae TaxID=162125 RepID=A0AAV0T414_HYABA|nr:unnamed protein product [Hyaloperonospora brassicae]
MHLYFTVLVASVTTLTSTECRVVASGLRATNTTHLALVSATDKHDTVLTETSPRAPDTMDGEERVIITEIESELPAEVESVLPAEIESVVEYGEDFFGIAHPTQSVTPLSTVLSSERVVWLEQSRVGKIYPGRGEKRILTVDDLSDFFERFHSFEADVESRKLSVSEGINKYGEDVAASYIGGRALVDDKREKHDSFIQHMVEQLLQHWRKQRKLPDDVLRSLKVPTDSFEANISYMLKALERYIELANNFFASHRPVDSAIRTYWTLFQVLLEDMGDAVLSRVLYRTNRDRRSDRDEALWAEMMDDWRRRNLKADDLVTMLELDNTASQSYDVDVAIYEIYTGTKFVDRPKRLEKPIDKKKTLV